MFENSIATLPSLWASMNSWFTPTVLFVLLNLMIGTVALTSTLLDTKKLERLEEGLKETAHEESEKQFDYYHQEHQENGEVMNSQYHFGHTRDSSRENLDDNGFIMSGFHHLNQENHEEEEEEAENVEDADELPSLEEVYSKVTTGHHVSRTKSDTEPSSGSVSTKLARKMRKSASMKSAFGHFEAGVFVENRRPWTMRERKFAKGGELDDEVDAKADDFITKFKEQLKLQRIDSLTRYKEMLSRGSGK